MTADKRRQYGTGSVFQRKSDGRFIGRIPAGWNPNGTRRHIQVSGHTEAEAKRKLRDKHLELAREGLPEQGTARATVKSWSTTWLQLHVKHVRPTTYTTDAGAVRKWIVPTIGHRKLAELTPGDIRAVAAAVTAAGLTTTTARHAHTVLLAMLRAASLEGHQVPQRVLLVKGPPKAVSDRDAIPLPSALAILEQASKTPARARWVAALLQGMRQGEALGLTWACVDLDHVVTLPSGEVVPDPLIDVSWQLQSLPYLDRAAGTFRVPDGYEARHLTHSYHLTRPKTSKGQRIIPLVPWMAAALREWRDIAPPNPWGLVWCGEDARNGQHRITPLRGRVDRAAWEQLQDDAKVRHPSGRYYTLHEARHTCATLLLEAGVDPETVKAIMGHSSIVTSRGYQHVSQQLTRTALEGVAARLGLEG